MYCSWLRTTSVCSICRGFRISSRCLWTTTPNLFSLKTNDKILNIQRDHVFRTGSPNLQFRIFLSDTTYKDEESPDYITDNDFEADFFEDALDPNAELQYQFKIVNLEKCQVKPRSCFCSKF